MRRFKYFICEQDLIFMAHGQMGKVRFYPRKPEQCQDLYCAANQIVEVFIHIPNPIKDGKGKRTGKNLDSSGKERKVAPEKLPRLSRNSTLRRKKSARKKNIA